jgi:peptidoglycan hydrolase CwlO-like protein
MIDGFATVERKMLMIAREVDLVQGRIDRRTDRIENLEQDSDDLRNEIETLKGQVRLSLLELGDSSSYLCVSRSPHCRP